MRENGILQHLCGSVSGGFHTAFSNLVGICGLHHVPKCYANLQLKTNVAVLSCVCTELLSVKDQSPVVQARLPLVRKCFFWKESWDKRMF